ncbi:MAG: sigma-70 family RNA polymerase sigma factor [Ruminococcus sp.]|jgi:RNA polymerase sporulation-specific sigma factor
MRNFDTLSDETLIAQMKNGQNADEISEYLMYKYKPLVRKKARAMYLVGGETDDLIQEGMLGLFKALRDFDPGKEASFSSFAGLCIERQLYNAIQSSNRQKHQPLNTYVSLSDEEFASELRQLSVQNPEAIIIDQENTAGIGKKIQGTLSKFENQVLKLYLEGADYIQIAERLGKPAKSIDNALQRIRQKVKTCIIKRS